MSIAVIAGALAVSAAAFQVLAAPNPDLDGDLNGDNRVDVLDLSYMLGRYGTGDASADINSDGSVTIIDLSILLTNYGRVFSAPSAVNLGRFPFAMGTGAGNHALSQAGYRSAFRLVAHKSGTLAKLHIKTKTLVKTSATDSYGWTTDGTYGRLKWVMYNAKPDGTPDTSSPLASEEFYVSSRASCTTAANGGGNEVCSLNVNRALTAGQEYYIVVSNTHPSPASNYFSTNHLWDNDYLQGANSRNERNAAAADNFYGLDPREVMVTSTNGGSTWNIPGVLPAGSVWPKAFPTYVAEWSDGSKDGQGYYSGSPVAAGSNVSMVYKPQKASTFTKVGGLMAASDSFTVTVEKNGTAVATAFISNGSGANIVEANLSSAVPVVPGDVIKLKAHVNASGALRTYYGDAGFAALMGFGASYKWYNEANSSQALSIAPLPWPR